MISKRNPFIFGKERSFLWEINWSKIKIKFKMDFFLNSMKKIDEIKLSNDLILEHSKWTRNIGCPAISLMLLRQTYCLYVFWDLYKRDKWWLICSDFHQLLNAEFVEYDQPHTKLWHPTIPQGPQYFRKSREENSENPDDLETSSLRIKK